VIAELQEIDAPLHQDAPQDGKYDLIVVRVKFGARQAAGLSRSHPYGSIADEERGVGQITLLVASDSSVADCRAVLQRVAQTAKAIHVAASSSSHLLSRHETRALQKLV
jgi:hypothetical protein